MKCFLADSRLGSIVKVASTRAFLGDSGLASGAKEGKFVDSVLATEVAARRPRPRSYARWEMLVIVRG